VEDIACATDADVASGHLVAGCDAVVLGVERDGGLLAGSVDVACSADATEETA
jgi:hypothetical protein